ncbi:MAG: L-seryl-tRNA(Sec) selenium transferase [candidate division Zixibacteria bacterium]|nr:L-seryl-tRNA(Sec) selenium transferase [candidate division Zixibacteria bacterium]
MNKQTAQEKLRALPSVEELLGSSDLKDWIENWSRPVVAEACRQVLAALRQEILSGDEAIAPPEISSRISQFLEKKFNRHLQPVINATGIILHTNLGRAPLSADLLAQMFQVSSGYNNLEFQLDSGQRGKRGLLAEELLCQLTGAGSACVVNNNAGALFLILSALAKGREVIVSRGELVQIGGGFRIPEILAQSGAVLKEVGATNQTTLKDYEQAITTATGLILKVHHSNFKMEGFVREATLAELSYLSQESKIPLIYDQGSGAVIDTRKYGLAAEPTVQDGLTSGADLVAFSGDKLLGGPQAGIIAGSLELVNSLKRHPLYRALRVDKFTISGLEKTILFYLTGQAEQKIPVWKLVSCKPEELKSRAGRVAAQFNGRGLSVVPSESYLGGGSLPGQALASFALSIESALNKDDLSAKFRSASPPVVGRISEDKLLLDFRAIFPEQDSVLTSTISKIQP